MGSMGGPMGGQMNNSIGGPMQSQMGMGGPMGGPLGPMGGQMGPMGPMPGQMGSPISGQMGHMGQRKVCIRRLLSLAVIRVITNNKFTCVHCVLLRENKLG